MGKEITVFNKEKIYKEEIHPLIVDLLQACNRHEMPLFLAVCDKNDVKGTDYKLEMISPTSNNIILTDDKVVDWVNVYNGFTTVYKRTDTEIDTDYSICDDLPHES